MAEDTIGFPKEKWERPRPTTTKLPDFLVKVGDPEDVVNINQYTDELMSYLKDILEEGAFDIEKMLPLMQTLSQQITDPLAEMMREGAMETFFGTTAPTLADQFAKMNAFRSGAYGKAYGKGYGEAVRGAEMDIGKMQMGMLSSLLSLSAQTDPFGMALQAFAQTAQPEWWQPTYFEKPEDADDSGFPDINISVF